MLPVHQVGLWRVGRVRAKLRVPQRRSVRRVIRDKVPRDIAREQQSTGRRQQPCAKSRVRSRSVRALPGDLPGLVVDRRQVTADRAHTALLLPAQAERTSRVGLSEVIQRVGFGRWHIKQTGLRTERRRRPVRRTLIRRRHERTRDVVVLFRDAHRLPLCVQLRLRPSSLTRRTCWSTGVRP